jgi:hypothetical protein
MHLTNYSINKLAHQNGSSAEPVQKWTLTEFWAYLDQHGHDSQALKENIDKVAIKAIISCESHIRAHAVHYNNYPFVRLVSPFLGNSLWNFYGNDIDIYNIYIYNALSNT